MLENSPFWLPSFFFLPKAEDRTQGLQGRSITELIPKPSKLWFLKDECWEECLSSMCRTTGPTFSPTETKTERKRDKRVWRPGLQFNYEHLPRKALGSTHSNTRPKNMLFTVHYVYPVISACWRIRQKDYLKDQPWLYKPRTCLKNPNPKRRENKNKWEFITYARHGGMCL